MTTTLYQILRIVQNTFNALTGLNVNQQKINAAIATLTQMQNDFLLIQARYAVADEQAFQRLDQRLDGMAAEQLDQAATLEAILKRVSPQPAVKTELFLGSPEPQ